MFKRFIAVCGCLLVASGSGCIYNEEPVPKIIHDYSLSEAVRPAVPAEVSEAPDEYIPKSWLPLLWVEKRWTAIIIHHSGTRNGSAVVFDKWHKEGKHWEGVGYDFVIGNGTNSGDGEVEVTYRWRNQQVGAHCGGTAGNWANKDGVGICLVGNFNRTVPTRQQIDSLVKLVRFLQRRYSIPESRIYGHKTTPGARATDCPGRRFSIAGLKSILSNSN